jgi:hypothetical protein
LIEIGSTLEGLDRADTFFQDSVVFVGMNPSVKGTSKGSTFGRLNEWVEELGVKRYGFMNAYPHPGKCKVSEVNLDNLRKALYNARKVVALGNFAAEALMKAGIHHFKLPHPSPLNRLINDPVYINRVLSECREFLSL